MSTSTLKQLPKATVEMDILIPWGEVQESYQKILDTVVATTEIEGFRKGKAPKNLVEQKVDKTKLYNQVIQELVPHIYASEVKKNNLIPVTNPKIEVKKAKEGQDWLITATIALKPVIKLKNYKEKIKDLKKSKVKIWVPGKDKKEEDKKLTLDEMMQVLSQEIEVELSDILLSEEANRLLSDLVDQTQKLGMTVEQYLMAKGKTTEQIRAEYAKQAQTNLTIQFGLLEIAETEKITVLPKDIDDILAKVADEQQREKLRKDSYYLAHLIRQQKTIDFLSNL
jgi:FKBP-type peptidyl-prolyl cis-trans isomerase (trigger factor)